MCTSMVRPGSAPHRASGGISAPPHPEAQRPIPAGRIQATPLTQTHPCGNLARWHWRQSIERTRRQRDDEAYNRGYQQAWADARGPTPSTREQWSQTHVKLYSEIGIQSGPGESSVSTSAGARPKAHVRSRPY